MDKITNEVLDKIRKVQDFFKKIENGYRIIYVCPICKIWKEEDGGPMSNGCNCVGERMAFIRTNFIFPELDKMKSSHEGLVEAAKGSIVKIVDAMELCSGSVEHRAIELRLRLAVKQLEEALKKAADGEGVK
jgi:hypothetical protein